MFPELNSGFLKLLRMGAHVIKPVFQVLGCHETPDAKDGHYRVIISDGETWCIALLGKKYNSMITNKKLDQYAIVVLNKYILKQAEREADKVLIILNLTVLVPGNKVNGKFGNPVNSSAQDVSNRCIANMPAVSDATVKDYFEAASKLSMMFPHLTAGIISRILREENEAKAAFNVQVVGLKKLEQTPYCYHLCIFDGVNAWPFVFLGTHLNHMVTNKELAESSVIRVDEYEYKKIKGSPSRIILLKITVLNSGNEGYKFWNPPCSSCGGPTCDEDTEHEEKMECSGSESMDSDEELERLVLKHNKKEAIVNKDKGNECFKAGDYDSAISYYTYGMLIDPLNAILPANRGMALLKKLEFELAEDDCTLCLSLDPSYVKAYLRRGTARRALKKYDLAHSDFLKALEFEPDNKQAQEELETVKICARLTHGIIDRIIHKEEEAKTPFYVRAFALKKVDGTPECYHLCVFDGDNDTSYVMLGTHLNHMVANKELDKSSVIRVDKYEYKQVASGEKRIVLLKISVLNSEFFSNEEFWNPCSSSSSGRTTTNAPAVKFAANTSYKKQKTQCLSMIDLPPVKFTQFLYTMFPEVASGAIRRILKGEEVANAVIQILGCSKMPAEFGSYRLLISDGVTSYSYAFLDTQLNHMVENKELEHFTIVRVEKYACNQVLTNQKVIILLYLTVLVPGNEVNKMLGNPVNYGSSDGDAFNAPVVNDVAEWISKTIIPHNSSKITLPQLTTGSINRIINEEHVENAVIQILGCKKIPGAVNDRYRLLISDGVTGCPFAMLGTQLSHMVANKELEKYTIVRVDKFVCNQVQADRKVIILLKLTALVSGNEVNKKLGNPVIYSSSDGDTTNSPAVNDVAEMNYSSDNAVASHDSSKTMFNQLTTGAINRILNGEDVANAVFQILGCKKIPGAGNDRYHLLISDGVTGWPFTLLGTQLNHMVSNKELEKFTVVRVDKCVCNQVQDRKVIILLELTVLVPGNKVNKKLGNPASSRIRDVATTDAPAVKGVVEMDSSNDNAVAANDLSKTMFPQLTNGAINRILKGEHVQNAVIQMLMYKKITGDVDGRYRLLISDGVADSPFAMLAAKLNNMVLNKELERFTIVRVDKYVCYQATADQKLIIFMKLTVLAPGNEVNKKLGNPVDSPTVSAATTNAPAVNDVTEMFSSNSNAVAAHDLSKITLPQLTAGAIKRILNGEEVGNAVMQILGYKKIPGFDGDRYRLIISDGVTGCSFAMLGTQLNHIVTNNLLLKYTIVRVDKYVCNQTEDIRKVIILLKLTILVPGNEVNEKLGNPVNSCNSDKSNTNAPGVEMECIGSS